MLESDTPGDITVNETVISSEINQALTATPSASKSYVPHAIICAGLIIAGAIVGSSLWITPQSNNNIIPDTIEDAEYYETSQYEPSSTIDDVEHNEPYEFQAIAADDNDYSQYYKNVISQDGVQWLTNPSDLGDLGLVTLAPESWLTQANFTPKYYQIGSLYGKPITYFEIPCEGMCFQNESMVFVGANPNEARLLGKYSVYDVVANYQYNQLALTDGVTTDNETVLEALDLDTVVYKGVPLISGQGLFNGSAKFTNFFANSAFNFKREDVNSNKVLNFLQDTQYGPLFSIQNINTEVNTASYLFAIRTPGGLFAPLRYKINYLTDDRVPQITWNDGSQNSSMYRSDGLGSCGGGGPEVTNINVPDTDTTIVGKTVNGEIVKTIINPNHPLIQRVFKVTQGEVYDYNVDSGESSTYIITPQEFIENRGVLLIENSFGQQNIFTHGLYGPQAECGKPVIYLYPEATTTISVKVDALITKSDPLYQDGWTVTASPEGKLIHNGKHYGSLFWDGYGNGPYPDITEGYVIKTEFALDLMGEHLKTMNFNETEIKEFKEFWLPHLPKTPYTQFNWLQTRDMENMASLQISPRPQTVIRAFVDFKGAENPFPIKSQTLEWKERKGYTVTEWGGVLRR